MSAQVSELIHFTMDMFFIFAKTLQTLGKFGVGKDKWDRGVRLRLRTCWTQHSSVEKCAETLKGNSKPMRALLQWKFFPVVNGPKWTEDKCDCQKIVNSNCPCDLLKLAITQHQTAKINIYSYFRNQVSKLDQLEVYLSLPGFAIVRRLSHREEKVKRNEGGCLWLRSSGLLLPEGVVRDMTWTSSFFPWRF